MSNFLGIYNSEGVKNWPSHWQCSKPIPAFWKSIVSEHCGVTVDGVTCWHRECCGECYRCPCHCKCKEKIMNPKIEELKKVFRVEKTFNDALNQAIENARSEGEPEELIVPLTKYTKETLFPNFVTSITQEWEKVFDEEVVDALIKFYSSPIGQRSLDVQENLMGSILNITQKTMQDIMEWTDNFLNGLSEEEYNKYEEKRLAFQRKKLEQTK